MSEIFGRDGFAVIARCLNGRLQISTERGGAPMWLPFYYLTLGLFALVAAVWSGSDGRQKAEAQEAKRYFYKIVDVPPDNALLQSVLNEYGAAGWELVVMSMGDMTAPRLIFKK